MRKRLVSLPESCANSCKDRRRVGSHLTTPIRLVAPGCLIMPELLDVLIQVFVQRVDQRSRQFSLLLRLSLSNSSCSAEVSRAIFATPKDRGYGLCGRFDTLRWARERFLPTCFPPLPQHLPNGLEVIVEASSKPFAPAPGSSTIGSFHIVRCLDIVAVGYRLSDAYSTNLITPQPMRAPAAPEGCEVKSSAPAWTMMALPTTSRSEPVPRSQSVSSTQENLCHRCRQECCQDRQDETDPRPTSRALCRWDSNGRPQRCRQVHCNPPLRGYERRGDREMRSGCQW